MALTRLQAAFHQVLHELDVGGSDARRAVGSHSLRESSAVHSSLKEKI
jgi:hypothetical protein